MAASAYVLPRGGCRSYAPTKGPTARGPTLQGGQGSGLEGPEAAEAGVQHGYLPVLLGPRRPRGTTGACVRLRRARRYHSGDKFPEPDGSRVNTVGNGGNAVGLSRTAHTAALQGREPWEKAIRELHKPDKAPSPRRSSLRILLLAYHRWPLHTSVSVRGCPCRVTEDVQTEYGCCSRLQEGGEGLRLAERWSLSCWYVRSTGVVTPLIEVIAQVRHRGRLAQMSEGRGL
jgi:hypothetical protein